MVSSFWAGLGTSTWKRPQSRQIYESRVQRILAGGITVGQRGIEAVSADEIMREDSAYESRAGLGLKK